MIKYVRYKMENLIPILGILTGMVVPIAVFLWLYHDDKHKRETVKDIARKMSDIKWKI